MNLVMLISATIGSMAFGVMTAYWIFRVGFALMRPQEPQPAFKPVRHSARLS